ncbi:MAG: sigma-70 family RNA polymerase sigma factor [Planctomycetes bacterium]|nr:sigma-70 family RNA polymerase sigma factor [Planctomycetota bacterium]
MSTILSDEALFLAFARSRDRDALDALVARRYEGAYAFAARALADSALAEDVTQDAFLSLARSAHRFRPGRLFRGWWTTILLNAIRSAIRDRRRRERREAATDPERLAARGADVERHALRDEIESLLREIPEELRLPVSLHYLDGWTHRQIAEREGCTVATASSRIRRGARELRRAFSMAAGRARSRRGAFVPILPAALVYAAYLALAIAIALLLAATVILP